jgi:hemolysin activation/secretion protein
VLALRLGIQSVAGDSLPVQTLISIGENSTLRGFSSDRFVDKTAALFNAELRFPIYRRFGGIIGVHAGKVWSSISRFDLKNWHMSPAAGLRFYMNTFVARLDIGFGKETNGVYFNFGHIF